MGYKRAGFEVVGVDIEPQPNYPFDFYRFDALDLLGSGDWELLGPFDGFHASPPCPAHSSLNGWSGDSDSPDLIPETRRLLEMTGLPYVIENVPGAPLLSPIQICGQGLGLKVRRHRLFEANFPMMGVGCHHYEPPVIVVGGSIGRKVFDPRRKAIAPTFEQAKEVMGMPWAKTRQEVVNAIPPAYTEHIGGYLMAEVQARQTKAAA
jgi:DNA (cytosine-5)-methyltransferase 1